MLRYHSKHHVIKKEWKDSNEIICTYHLKTLMLWACELKPLAWWESNCVIDICSQLLDKLRIWLTRKLCPHYFIPEWNLFDYQMTQSRYKETIEVLLVNQTSHNLANWFRCNYLPKIIANARISTIPPGLTNLCLEVASIGNYSTTETIRTLLTAQSEWYSFYFINHTTTTHYFLSRWSKKRFYKLLITDTLRSENQRLADLACVLLRLAWNFSCKSEGELSNADLLDVMSTVVMRLSRPNPNSRISYSIPLKNCSNWYYYEGVKLLSANFEKSSAEYYLWIKTCKRFFKAAINLQHRNCYSSEWIPLLSHAYLAAIYYVSNRNSEKALKHCSGALQRISFQNTSQSQFFYYFSLLLVEEVTQVCGFCFIFSHTAKLQTTRYPEIRMEFSLARFLHCLSLLSKSHQPNPVLNDCPRSNYLPAASPQDMCLYATCWHKCRRIISGYAASATAAPTTETTTCVSEDRTGEILCSMDDGFAEILLKLAINNFTKFAMLELKTVRVMSLYFHIDDMPHFKALYYFKIQEYKKVLDICNSIILREYRDRSFKIGHMYKYDAMQLSLYRISVLQSFQLLFGSSISSLTGLIAIIERLFLPQGVKVAWNNFGRTNDERDSNGQRAVNSSGDYDTFCGEIKRGKSHFGWAQITLMFATRYLRLKSLVELNYSKIEILMALKQLNSVRNTGLVFERILAIFETRKLERE